MTTDTALLRAPALPARPRPDAPARAALHDLPAAHLHLLGPRAVRVVQRFAPVWPLESFVAVNTFMGYADRPFDAAVTHLARVQGARALPSREAWREAWRSGRLTREDLRAGAAGRHDVDVDTMIAALERPAPPLRAAVPTVAQVLDAQPGREGPWSTLLFDEIGKGCAAWFDRGQAAWPLGARGSTLYDAWRAVAAIDRTPAIRGLAGFGAAVARLPADPVAAIAEVLARLGWPKALVDDYLERALSDVAGWAAAARHRAWTAGLAGGSDDSALHLLAIRLAWDGVLFELRRPALAEAWTAAVAQAARDRDAPPSPALGIDLAWQAAWERSARRALGARMRSHAAPRSGPRPAAQAVFCIDVRSEVLRRHLEAAWPDLRTRGFAGFFGLPISLVGEPGDDAQARCPALLAPALEVERACDDPALAARADRASRTQAAWQGFRGLAVAGFAQVEAMGWAAAFGLARSRGAKTHPSATPDTAGQAPLAGRYVRLRLRPRLAPTARIDMAAAVLGAMQLGADCAPLVLLAGHDAAVTNNPHAASLACGACGGRGGEVNARVAADLLNDPDVRAGLAARGVAIPGDTWFVAAVHDTTTDTVTLFGHEAVPPRHAAALARLREALARAGAAARAERAPRLGVGAQAAARRSPAALRAALARRAADDSELRPEWGLAGNHAFIAAPRALTRGLDLGGRAFLHDYDAAADPDGRVLALILTAPLVVASWINLQYYASTVEPARWGSGDKTLHNVVGGGVGVLLGNGGDLRVGLPWQSVHDGRRFMHEPLRLTAFVAAPREAIDRVVASHAGLRDLLGNGWIHLHQVEPDGRRHWVRDTTGAWAPDDGATA
jgi:hypothetical protein